MSRPLFLVAVLACDSSGLPASDVGGTVLSGEQSETSSGTVASPTDGTPSTPGSTPTTTTTTTTTPSTTTTTTTTNSGSGGSATVACYPGLLDDWTTCLDTQELNPVPADYVYPAPIDNRYLAPIRFLDLAVEDPSLPIAPNFILSEVAQEWKGQWGVVQPHAIDRLQAVRNQLGPTIVNSGYRSPDYNAYVGGATWSRHMYGDAFDLVAVNASLYDLEAECLAEGAGFVSVYVSHVHCDWRDDALDPVFFGAALPLLSGVERPEEAGAELLVGVPWTAPATGFDEGEPLRTWRAFDDAGWLLEEVDDATYLPPVDAAWVEVEVGGRVTLSAEL